MILLYGGRERTPQEWRQMAKLAGLKVTFEGFPESEPGTVIVEFRKTGKPRYGRLHIRLLIFMALWCILSDNTFKTK